MNINKEKFNPKTIQQGEKLPEIDDKISQPENGLQKKEDMDRWVNGSERFHSLCSLINLEDKVGTETATGFLQALFLGERGVCFRHIIPNAVTEIIKNHPELGLSVSDQFIYDPKIVDDIAKRNPDIFGERNSEEIANSSLLFNDFEHSEEVGLLLGFPRKDVEYYKSVEALYSGITKLMDNNLSLKLKTDPETEKIVKDLRNFRPTIKQENKEILANFLFKNVEDGIINSDDMQGIINAFEIFVANKDKEKAVDVYGIQWKSVTKGAQDRLKTAFESSGILLPSQIKEYERLNRTKRF